MTYEAVKRDDVRSRIAETLAGYEAEQGSDEKPESYFIKKEIRRIDTTFERIWHAIEDGIAPPGGKERIEELNRQKSELEARLCAIEKSESFEVSVDDVLLWLDDLANDTTPLEILNEWVRFVDIDGNDISVYFMFDDLPDDFNPTKKKPNTLAIKGVRLILLWWSFMRKRRTPQAPPTAQLSSLILASLGYRKTGLLSLARVKIAISGVCKTPDGRLAVSPSNVRAGHPFVRVPRLNTNKKASGRGRSYKVPQCRSCLRWCASRYRAKRQSR